MRGAPDVVGMQRKGTSSAIWGAFLEQAAAR